MGYLFLGISLLALSTKGYCGKKISKHTNGFRDAIIANILRMVLCSVIGFVLVVASGNILSLVPSFNLLLISALSGISTAALVVTWLMSVRTSAYMMVDIFLMLGVLIPIIASNILFSETVKLTQWIGVGILFVAAVMMCSYNNSIKAKITPSSLIILIVCGVSNGFIDFSQKLFVKHVQNGSVAVFNFYTYIFATLFLVLTFLTIPFKTPSDDKGVFKKTFGYILVMAACLFATSYFKTLAAEYLSSVLLYPLNQGFSLISAALMSAVFFKEKITSKAVVGIVTAFLGLIITNLL